MTKQEPSIFDYLDYRMFLQDKTSYLKTEKKFNVRLFAKNAKLKSPGFLKMVIDGARDITPETAHKFAKALSLTKQEENYFTELVNYNQESDPTNKHVLLDQILKARPRTQTYLLEQKHNRYFSKPYYVCIREMVALTDFNEDPKWIASRCFPKIKPSQAKEAIKTLLELGLLERTPSGSLKQSAGFLQTEDQVKAGIEIYHYHEAIIDKARHALGLLPQEKRNYFALTLPIPNDFYPEIVEELKQLRDKLAKKIEEKAKSEPLDEVFQINFQFFPLTQRRNS